LMPETLTAGQVLQTPDRPLEVVYFLGGGVCSMGVAVADGSVVEVTAIGCEGMVGIEAVLGGREPVATVAVHVGTRNAYRMPVAVLLDALKVNPACRDLLMRYAQAMFGSIVHAAACNTLHTADQRLARALLVMHDRLNSDTFPFTQDMLAVMLGVRRPTVTLAAGALQRDGIIHYQHGRIHILNREGLEAAACECYQEVANTLRRLIPETFLRARSG
jgi:CRP-like cAMP-binding protein